MRRFWLLMLAVIALSGCGKNDNFSGVPGGYYPPSNYGQYPTPPYFPGNQMPPPQMFPPQQRPPQQLPPDPRFIQIYTYFQQSQQLAAYWQQLWMRWQMMSSQSQNFNSFWGYCQDSWGQQPGYTQVYTYYDTNFYGGGGCGGGCY